MGNILETLACTVRVGLSFKGIVPSVSVSAFRFSLAYQLSEEFMECLVKHRKPQYQKLCLLDLPVEILERIGECCDDKSLRQLYATCRQLRLLALEGVYTVGVFIKVLAWVAVDQSVM